MKNILIALLLVFLTSCSSHEKNPDMYYNYRITIIEKGGYAERNGKFTNVGKYFLVRSLSDTTLYTELNGYNFNKLDDRYGSSLYWSKDKGDTLYFEYISKKRFWKLKK